ncbi:MAG: hypothetical protein M1818_002779 [Claussenomyces sp. TS43310]|nr:MAG: hypothetical protein M1818_002779 [Claussenomyces sp. TS43310]
MPCAAGLLGRSLLETHAQLQAERASFTEIPVIDIGGLQSSMLVDRLAVAEKVRDACIRAGFFYVSNHGVDQEVIDGLFAASRRFFALPLEEKSKVAVKEDQGFKGYENKKEAFNFGYEPSLDPDTPGDVPWILTPDLQAPNVWPDVLGDEWKKDVFAYYGQVLQLGRRLLKAFALVLDLPETYFDADFVRPGAIMTLLRYPASELDPNNPGIGAHRDYECTFSRSYAASYQACETYDNDIKGFTILLQEDTNGLQVQTPEGNWIEAPPKPGTFVVNIANFLERWTNDVLKSTTHRVYNLSRKERYSCPIFFGPNYNTKVGVISTCVSAERPARYGEVVAGEHVAAQLYKSVINTKSKIHDDSSTSELMT